MGSGIKDSIFPELFVKDETMSFTEYFEKVCPSFMSIGVSYEDFWNGEFEITKFALEADKITQKRKNSEAWLNSIYFFRALLDASPAFHEFSGGGERKISYYVKQPFPIGTKEIEKRYEENQINEVLDIRERLMSFAKSHNEKIK